MMEMQARQWQSQGPPGAAAEGFKIAGASDDEAELPCETSFQQLPADELALQQQQRHKQQQVLKQQLECATAKSIQAVQQQQQGSGNRAITAPKMI